MEKTQSKHTWSPYYKNQKKVWYNPKICVYIKAILRIVELHRSDSEGWSLSIRKIAGLLGVSTNTVLKYIDEAISLGLLESTGNHQRKRRKLRLSVLLRAPLEWSEDSYKTDLFNEDKQPVSTNKTYSVSTVAPLNSNSNIKTNNPASNSFKKVGEITASAEYKKGEGYKRLLLRVKQLRNEK